MTLRPYQSALVEEIYDSWRSGHRNVIGVLPTGGGKTKTVAHIFKDLTEPGIEIAHRQELVGQLSASLAAEGIYHNIIAPEPVIRFCIHRHINLFNKNFHHPAAPIAVAGVDTLLARADKFEQWRRTVKLWMTDECHHLAGHRTKGGNKWWKAADMFVNAVGLGVTATPIRCDKQPLGRKFGGYFDKLVIGPTMRELINAGYLCDYRIFAPPSSIDFSTVKVSETTGDFNEHAKVEAAEKSQIVGDIIAQYLKIAPGKRGITFVSSVKQAQETAQRFVAAGVPAECVHGKSEDAFRQRCIDQLARGDLKQLVNVGLFGEGTDVPVVEVVCDGDGTMSFVNFAQRFGRMLRPAPGKPYGIYIDHVENVLRHGLPDAPRNWSLDIDYRGSKRGRDENVMPVRTCMQCDGAYEAITRVCPYCGYVDTPSATARNDPAQVDGDLLEMSPELLARLRGEIGKIDHEWNAKPSSPAEVVRMRNHAARYDTLQELRQVINYWAGVQVYGMGRSESESYMRFFHRFNIDVMTAQTLSAPEMRALADKIRVDTI